MRRAARVDNNHREIKGVLEAMGCTVADTSTAGSGFPDLVVGCSGTNILMEIKDGNKPPSARGLTPQQQIFHTQWRGQVAVVENVSDAITVVNAARKAK